MGTQQDVLAIVEAAIINQPRSQQVEIGPSELGVCDRCLGHKLAGTPRTVNADWLPYVGTAMHNQLENVFLEQILASHARGEVPRWSTETRLYVGDIDGQPIHGHGDLFDHHCHTSVDYKLVGPTTIKAAKAAPRRQYRWQGHTYGLGWTRKGVRVETIAIWYLPRNATRLNQGYWWQEPYDENIALQALARADAFARTIRTIGAEQFLPTLQRDPSNCYECPKYPPFPTDPPLPTGQEAAFADLLPAA